MEEVGKERGSPRLHREKKKGRKRSRSRSMSPTMRKRKKNKIKGAGNPYSFFMKEERKQFQDKNPTADFGELAKIMGEYWRTKMTDEDKLPYKKMAEEDKKRYQREMDEASSGSSSEEKKKPAKKKKRVPKDPNEPKKPLNAYILWSKENRKLIAEKHPNSTGKKINKLCGRYWRELPEDEKKPYRDQWVKDKEKYEVEMAEYKKKKKAEEKDTPVKSDKSDKEEKSKEKSKEDTKGKEEKKAKDEKKA